MFDFLYAYKVYLDASVFIIKVTLFKAHSSVHVVTASVRFQDSMQ